MPYKQQVLGSNPSGRTQGIFMKEERFLRCPKINRIITYGKYCVFECPNRKNVIAEWGKNPIVECFIDGEIFSIQTISADEEKKLMEL